MSVSVVSQPLAPLPPADTLLEVRTGKIRPFGTTRLRSAIAKAPRQGLLAVGTCGLVGDEQQYAHHGGVDKALHQYCSGHYPTWQAERPDKAHLYVWGGFGENLVSTGRLNEDNVCIGDVFSIGNEVRVMVTEPRLPCYKLNHRFEWNRAALRAQQTGRTGWYLSVVQTGRIKAGDVMTLESRPYPRWSIHQTLRVMYENQDPALLQELAQLVGLGHQIREIVEGRLAGQAEDTQARLDRVAVEWRPFRLVEKMRLTPTIQKLVLSLDDADLRAEDPAFGPYPYVRLRFGPQECYTRAYSVVRGSKDRFELGVALSRTSRGGSRFLHEQLAVGSIVSVANGPDTADGADVEVDPATHRVFIVGGIGITAFVREIERLQAQNASFEVHYACASLAAAAYRDILPLDKTTYYAKDQGRRLAVDQLIPDPKSRSGSSSSSSSSSLPLILCCGPVGLLEDTEQRAGLLDYPENLCHFESFDGQRANGEPFEAEIASTGAVLQVPGDQSLLQVLNDAGFDTPSSCRVGNCGMCMVDYKRGTVKHKGTALARQQKCTSLLSCVSRGKGRLLLDL